MFLEERSRRHCRLVPLTDGRGPTTGTVLEKRSPKPRKTTLAGAVGSKTQRQRLPGFLHGSPQRQQGKHGAIRKAEMKGSGLARLYCSCGMLAPTPLESGK